MSEKRFGLGKILFIGAAAAAIGGVISYLNREEIKRLAEDISAKMKTAEETAPEEPEEEETAEELVDIVISAEEEAEAALEEDSDVVVEITVEPDEAETENATEE